MLKWTRWRRPSSSYVQRIIFQGGRCTTNHGWQGLAPTNYKEFLPIWFMLCFLPLEFFFSQIIVKQLGRVLAEDIPSDATRDHKFCIAMDVIQGWVASVGILSMDGKVVEVALGYDSFYIQCPNCPNLLHGVE